MPSIGSAKGLWNATTNTPYLSNNQEGAVEGDNYLVVVAGTHDFGNGPVTFKYNNLVLYDGSNQWIAFDLTPCSGSSGSGITSVSVATANGFAGSSSGGTTPIITLTTSVSGLLIGNGTAISAASDSDVTGKLLTGYVSGPGVIAASDSILQAIQKLNGNIAGLTAVTSVFGRTGAVVAASGDYSTLLVTENTNLYFTDARAVASPLTGYVSGAGTVSATDSVLSAIQKLNGNTSALVTGVSSVFGRTGAVTAAAADYNGIAMTGITSVNGLVITANTGVVTTATWNATVIAMQYGGTSANLTASNGGIIYSTASAMAVLAGTATANKMLLSGSTAAPSWSTSTIPSSAGATAGKILKSDGTNYILSTATFSDAPSTAGKIMVSDGTNWITSTPTYPNASATTRKIIVSDGTNFVASTETWATPGISGTLMRSDGTNWIATANPIVNNAVTASSNAATVPVTYRLTTVTNNAAGTVAITITTSGATDGQLVMVRFYDFSAVAQTLSWVNTENSTVSAPTTSNGSTTLPLTIGFQYNSATSKWRCIASS